jgi:hypothetical protein
VFFPVIIDAYSRMILGWQLASHMRTTLVLGALRMALARRGGGAERQRRLERAQAAPGDFDRADQRPTRSSNDACARSGRAGRGSPQVSTARSRSRSTAATSYQRRRRCARSASSRRRKIPLPNNPHNSFGTNSQMISPC